MSYYFDILKKAGVKLTRPRKMVLDILKTTKKPLSMKEIHKRIRRKADLASVYRTVNLFRDLGIVREIPLGEGFQRYELTEKGKHNHYILCIKCGKLDDIDVCLLKQVEKMTSFKIISHTMEFQGVCTSCSS